MENDFAIAGQRQVGFLEHGCSLKMYQGAIPHILAPLCQTQAFSFGTKMCKK